MAILAGELSALAVLHRLGSYGPAIRWGDVGRWLAETPPEDALVAVIRLATLALAWWLTATTVLYVLAGATRVTTLVRGVRWATLPAVRRIIDGLLASTIVAGTTLAPVRVAVAQPNQRDPIVVSTGEGSGGVVGFSEYRPQPAGGIARRRYHPKAAGNTAPEERKTPFPTETPRAPTYLVVQGDSLWRIAERRVEPSVDREAIRLYWIRLIEANGHLSSGNPNLIYVTEVINLALRVAVGS